MSIKGFAFSKILLLTVFFLGLAAKNIAYAGTLSCSVTSAASCTDTVVLRMSDSSNAHAELPSQSTTVYDNNVVCCSGITGLTTFCTGTYATVLKLSAITNAHVEQNTESHYIESACLSVPDGGTIDIDYQATNCSGFDTTLASMEDVTNSHVGNPAAYSGIQICGTASLLPDESLAFDISDNTIGFGTLSRTAARYATDDTTGSSSDTVDAHTITVTTNSSSGYLLTLDSDTLSCDTCGPTTIAAIGSSATASSAGSDQFGLRLIVNSGTGTAIAPYDGANWALDPSNHEAEVATGDGDEVETEFGVRYIANIASSTEPGSYSTVLTYTVTAIY